MKSNKGFTVLEVTIAICIIGIIAAIVVPSLVVDKDEREKGLKIEFHKVEDRNSKEVKSQQVSIECINGYKWVVQGYEKWQLGISDTWGDLKPITCE